ncbi:MAG: hypothetical protein Aureis2KO_20340 [Aureisphaera sp.]
MSKVGNIFHILFGKKKEPTTTVDDSGKGLLKVYSHPRSGTHFLEAFIGRNFYPGMDLLIKPVIWGHWSDRRQKLEGNPYGKLFGSHYFPDQIEEKGLMIYIVRDPRAVAWSIWKTPNFVHGEHRPDSFSEFLRTPLDWRGSPARKRNTGKNSIEHWLEHVMAWEDFAHGNANIIIVRYEDLVDAPVSQYEKIRKTFFKELQLDETSIDAVSDPVGLLPNKARKDAWKSNFTPEDIDYINSLVPQKYQERYFNE